MTTPPPIAILDSLLHLDAERDMPLHAQVRSALNAAIRDHFEDGQQFWTEQMLIGALSVSQITVRRALSDLAKEGILVRYKSKGSRVRKVDLNTTCDYRVGLFLPQYDSDALRQFMEQFVAQCKANGRRLDLHFVQQSMTSTGFKESLERGPEEQRLVFVEIPMQQGDGFLRIAKDRGYSISTIEMFAPHICASVWTDDKEGTLLAMKHLARLGHRRVTLVVNETEASRSVATRRKTFEQECANLGLKGRVVSCGTRFWESAYDAAYDAMPGVWGVSPDERPTAIITVSDVGAWAILKWLTQNGIRVPWDVSVVGYNDERPSLYTIPALTTVRMDIEKIVKAALNMLDIPYADQTDVMVHPNLIIRDSTAPPSSGGVRRSSKQRKPDTSLLTV